MPGARNRARRLKQNIAIAQQQSNRALYCRQRFRRICHQCKRARQRLEEIKRWFDGLQFCLQTVPESAGLGGEVVKLLETSTERNQLAHLLEVCRRDGTRTAPLDNAETLVLPIAASHCCCQRTL